MNKTRFLNLKELVIVLLLACVETAIALVTAVPFAANLQLVYFLAPACGFGYGSSMSCS